MMTPGWLLSQVPFILLYLVAAVVALLVIKGPGRWLVVGSLAVTVGTVLVNYVAIAADPSVRPAVRVLGAVLGVVSYALLAASVIVGRFWARRQPPVRQG